MLGGDAGHQGLRAVASGDAEQIGALCHGLTSYLGDVDARSRRPDGTPAQNMPDGTMSIALCRPLRGCLRVVRVEQSGGDRGLVHSGIVAFWRL